MRREKQIAPEKVAIYIRWSTDDQADGTTLEVQLEGCKHYLLSQGWIVNEDLIFVDDGWSGGNLERPALSRMRTMVKAGQIDCVVVFKLDRLSRSVIDMVNLVLEEWDGLTFVKSAREPLDTSSAMGKQFFYMLVSFAEWERNVIRERTTSGRQARAKEGYKASSRAPFGYKHGATKGSYELDELEAPVVQRIFQLYSQGLGAKAIALKLNQEGCRFRDGDMWNVRTLTYILSNPVYTGKMVYGKMSRNPRRAKAEDEPYWVKNEQFLVVENSSFIPALVEADVFAQVQQVKAGRRPEQLGAPSPRTVASPYLITGVAKCRCGYSLYAKVQKKSSKEYHHYACLGKKIKGTVFCNSANIPREILDKQVEQEVMSRFGDRVARERYRDTLARGLEAEVRDVAAVGAQVDQRIAKLEAEEKRLRSEYREQTITVSEFRALRKDLQDELQEVRTQKQQLGARRIDLEQRQQALSVQLQAIGQMEKWAQLTPQEKKNLLQCFVQSMTAWLKPGDREVQCHFVWRTESEAASIEMRP